MKRILFGAIIALSVAACGGAEEATEEVVTVDTAAVIELENATQEVDLGLEKLENEVNDLNNDIDSLLNGI
jgi:hypothetical protein